jgi:hypothetical protein
MSYKVEVKVYGESKWGTNAIRLATQEEARAYAMAWHLRWLAMEEWRIAKSDEPVNYRVDATGSLERIDA